MQVLADWTNQYGSIFKWNMVGVDILVITDPEEVAKLSSREANLPKAKMLYDAINTVRPHSQHSICLFCCSRLSMLLADTRAAAQT